MVIKSVRVMMVIVGTEIAPDMGADEINTG
jgi:hypothetical protein